MPNAKNSSPADAAAESGSSFFYRTLKKVVRHPSLDLKARSKIVLRMLSKPSHALRLERLFTRLGLIFITDKQPRLFEKSTRPYLVRGLGANEKLDMLCGHYEMLAKHFSRDCIEAMYTAGQPLLVDFLPELGAEIVLHYGQYMEKEGEATLSMFMQGERVYSLSFLLGAEALYIGSLQGSRSSLTEIRRFTKLSHGLRPQNFLVFLARIIAQHLGLPTILAIRNDNHIYSSKKRTQDRVMFDYDTFWGETGGSLAGEHFFSLPLEYPRKEHADIPMNKRAQYRRRYELLDNCAAALVNRLDSLRPAA